MTSDQIHELIRRHGLRSREYQQVAERLKKLLPNVLRSLKHSHQRQGAVAERHALTDPAYLERINEYLDVYADGLTARVQTETHRMLLDAWRSLNAWQRVVGPKSQQQATARDQFEAQK